MGSVCLGLMLLTPSLGLAAPGQLDVGFASSNTFNSLVQSIALQPDGRVLVGGQFNSVYGAFQTGLVRLHEDGTLDDTFDVGLAPAISHIVVQPDGKILVSGSFLTFNGYQRNSIVRLMPDGKVDPTFKTLYTPSPVDIRHFVVRGDGKIYVKGEFSSFGGHVSTNVVRLNADGTVDASFTSPIHYGGISTLALAPDAGAAQSLYVGGVSFVFAPGTIAENRRAIGRLDALTGVFDSGFNVPSVPMQVAGAVTQLWPLSDGRLLAAGVQGSGGTNAYNGMLRFMADGSVDPTFQAGPVPNPFDPSLASMPFQAMVRLPDGRIVAGGSFAKVQGLTRSNLVQLLPDGAVDPGFAPNHGPSGMVVTMALQPDGKILVGGYFTHVDGVLRPYLARIHGNGSPPLVLESPQSLTVWEGEPASFRVRSGGDPDPTITWYRGSSVVGAGKTLTFASAAPSDAGQYFARLQNVHGTLDTAMVTLVVNSGPPQITQQPKNTTVGMGATARFEPELLGTRPFHFQWFEDGLLMPGQTNAVLDIHVEHASYYGRRYYAIINTPRGSIATDEAEILPTLEGQPDRGFLVLEQSTIGGSFAAPSFRLDLRAAKSLALQPDGHVLVGGGVMTLPKPYTWDNPFAALGITQFSNHLVRLNLAGELDLGDLATQYLDGPVTDLAVAADGSFYAVGGFAKLGDTPRSRLIKFNANAVLEAPFSVSVLPAQAQVTCVAVHQDGRVVIGGTFTNVGGWPRTNIAQLLPDGSVDVTFVPKLTGVHYGKVLDVATQADGKVLAAGSGAFLQGSIYDGQRPQLVRFNADGSWDEDFDTYGGAMGNAEEYSVRQVIVQPDQRILISGSFNRFGGEANTNIARLLPSGASDPAFDPRGECCADTGAGVNGIALSPDGRIYVAGQFNTPQSNVTEVVRLDSDGRYDPSWFPAWVDAEPLIYQQENVTAVIVQADLRPVLAGNFIVPAYHHVVDTPVNVTKYYWEQNHSFASSSGTGTSGSGGAVVVKSQPSMPVVWNGTVTVPFHVGGLVRLFDHSAQPGALTIYVQPKGAVLSVNPNHAYMLAVVADIPNASARLSYQWMKNGLVLQGGTNSFYTIDPITLDKAGGYSVLVSAQPSVGPGQNLFSETAQVKVLPAGSLIGLPALLAGGFHWKIIPVEGQSFSVDSLANLQLQRSSNLVDWITMPGALQILGSELVGSDPDATPTPYRFYRLQQD